MAKNTKRIKIHKSIRLPYTKFIPTVVVLIWSFTFFVALLESGMCDYSEYPEELWKSMTDADIQDGPRKLHINMGKAHRDDTLRAFRLGKARGRAIRMCRDFFSPECP